MMNWPIVCAAALMPVLLAACSGKPPRLGVADGRLAPCPSSPNCVSTQATDPGHQIAPIPFTGEPKQAMARLRAIIAQRGGKIAKETDDYVHAEFTSRIFRFVDDVEFYVDAKSHTIQFRSASRVGHSDLGVNRRRMEAIRRAFLAPS